MGKEDYISLGAKEPLKVMIRTQQLKVCKQRNGIVEVALCKERKQERMSESVTRASGCPDSTLGES